jgi:hypothetical protein
MGRARAPSTTEAAGVACTVRIVAADRASRTNQITRAANDAIHAYRRAQAAVHAELQMPGGDRKQAQRIQLLLDGGRADILRVLEVTSRRYSWADPWPSDEGRTEAVRPEDGEQHGH